MCLYFVVVLCFLLSIFEVHCSKMFWFRISNIFDVNSAVGTDQGREELSRAVESLYVAGPQCCRRIANKND